MKYDTAVVGAGPSGAWAAYCLARRGVRVAIFDPSHPREKPCGGGVTGRALTLVADAIDRSTVAVTTIRTARIRACGASTSRDEAIVPLAADSLVVASRAALDAALLDAALGAGASLHRSRVTAVIASASRTRIDTREGSHEADWVIGADGANSLVRRSVALPFRRDQLSIATGFFARGTTSREIVIEMTADPPGYIWSFPRPDHLAIGICAQADGGASAAMLRARTLQWIRTTGIAGDAPLHEYSWPIPSLAAQDFGRLTLAGPLWSLTGDAAGLVDPITREGIFFAIASGEWSADAIVAGGPPETVARTYAARVHDEAAPDLARGAQLKAGFFRPAFGSLMVRALQESDSIRGVMADLVAGEQSYRSLKWRLAKTMEMRLAWKCIRRLKFEA
jgi:geranylgeranyl reductase family protein